MQFLHESQNYTYVTIQNYLHSLAFYVRQSKEEYPSDPTKSTQISDFMKGLSRCCKGGFPPNRKEGISGDDLEEISKIIDKTKPTQIRDFTCMTTMFSGFLRISEALSLRREDVDICDNFMMITIKSSKTDQEGKREKVYISQTSKERSAYNWMKLYLESNTFEANQKLFDLSVQTMIRKIKYYMKKINKDPSKIGSHSLRRGGAHEASINGAQDCAIKAHGRWKS